MESILKRAKIAQSYFSYEAAEQYYTRAVDLAKENLSSMRSLVGSVRRKKSNCVFKKCIDYNLYLAPLSTDLSSGVPGPDRPPPPPPSPKAGKISPAFISGKFWLGKLMRPPSPLFYTEFLSTSLNLSFVSFLSIRLDAITILLLYSSSLPYHLIVIEYTFISLNNNVFHVDHIIYI